MRVTTESKSETVITNRDPWKMGRVLTSSGWLHPLKNVPDKNSCEEFCVPADGATVTTWGRYYVAY